MSFISKSIFVLALVCAVSIDLAFSQCCPSCFNGGVLDPVSCGCGCPPGFQGPRCQYSLNPCMEEDQPYCANVNCFNATEFDFYNCQRKCLCCSNEQCYNLGTLAENPDNAEEKCKCKCVSSIYDPADNCKTIKECRNENDGICYGQFGGVQNCAFAFVKAMCPLMCEVCSA